MYRINQVFENKIPQPEMFNEVNQLQESPMELVNNEEKNNISDEDLQVLKEMEEYV